ncbi:hypothetical protein ABKV19_022865 [Rosa sericea]
MALFRGAETSSSKYATSPSGTSYDMFLSFRGEDTRKTFTDHLYTALVNAGLRTFRDDLELEKGESVKENLVKAVQQSRCSVIVLSKDYAITCQLLSKQNCLRVSNIGPPGESFVKREKWEGQICSHAQHSDVLMASVVIVIIRFSV